MKKKTTYEWFCQTGEADLGEEMDGSGRYGAEGVRHTGQRGRAHRGVWPVSE